MRSRDISQRTMERKKKYGKLLSHLVLGAISILSGPAISAADTEPWPLTLRVQMARLTRVGYRIGVVATPLCPSTSAGTGMGLDYLESYPSADRVNVAAVLRMTAFPQVAAVAPNSPADAAGVKPGDDIISIDGIDVAQLIALSPDTSLFADELEQRLAATPKGFEIRLGLQRNGEKLTVKLEPHPICSTRLVLKTGLGITAFSDGVNVAISSKLVAFANNDDELALIAAHEVAHVINLDGKAGSLGARRRMEDRADALGVRIMACAAYDPERSFNFWRRRDATDWLRMFRDPTHRSRKSRVELMRKESSNVSCPPHGYGADEI